MTDLRPARLPAARPLAGLLPLLILLLAGVAGTGCSPSGADRPATRMASTRESEGPGSEIAGTVLLDGAADHTGIEVFLPGKSAAARTDASGAFVIGDVGPGDHEVRARHAGYVPVLLARVVVAEGERKRFVLGEATLEPAPPEDASAAAGRAMTSIRGVVNYPPDAYSAGLPMMGGGRVELDGTYMRTISDDDGSFFFWNVETGYYALRVRYPGYLEWRAEIAALDPATPFELVVPFDQLEPEAGGIEIAGTLEMIGADGAPLFAYETAKIGVRELPGRVLRANVAGAFVLRGIAPGSYRLHAEAPGFEPSGDVLVEIGAGERVETTLTLVQLPPPPASPGSIVGRAIRDEEGAELAGVQVAIAGTQFAAVTDSRGAYRIEGVPPGFHELIAQAEGYASARLAGVEVRSGEETLATELRLEPVRDYPVVLRVDPPPGTRDFPVAGEMLVTVRFSKKMDGDSVKDALRIEPAVDFQAFMGREHRLSDYDLLVVEIRGASRAAPPKFDTAYRLSISTGAEDFEGLHLREAFSTTFRTGSAAVVGSAPRQGAREASLNPGRPVVIHFNAPLDFGSIDARDIRIRPTVGIPTVQTFTDPTTGWSSLHVQTLWQAGTKYELTLPRRIRTTGGQLVSNLPWRLEFETAPDVQMPGLETGRRDRAR